MLNRYAPVRGELLILTGRSTYENFHLAYGNFFFQTSVVFSLGGLEFLFMRKFLSEVD